MAARPTVEAYRTLMGAERRDIRQLIGQLAPEQWPAASLCAEWSVRDLVAHLVAWDDLLLYRTRRQHLRVLLRFSALYVMSLASLARINRRLAPRTDGLTPEELLARFGADDGPDLKWLFDRSNPGGHFAEYVIHHQDIRRPLGLPRQVPPERVVAALDGLVQLPGVRWSAWWQMRRRRFEATDVDWGRGRGPVVRGTGEAILMTLAGRAAAGDELRGALSPKRD